MNVSPAKGGLCGAIILFSSNILSPFLLAKTLRFCFRAIIPLDSPPRTTPEA